MRLEAHPMPDPAAVEASAAEAAVPDANGLQTDTPPNATTPASNPALSPLEHSPTPALEHSPLHALETYLFTHNRDLRAAAAALNCRAIDLHLFIRQPHIAPIVDDVTAGEDRRACLPVIKQLEADIAASTNPAERRRSATVVINYYSRGTRPSPQPRATTPRAPKPPGPQPLGPKPLGTGPHAPKPDPGKADSHAQRSPGTQPDSETSSPLAPATSAAPKRSAAPEIHAAPAAAAEQETAAAASEAAASKASLGSHLGEADGGIIAPNAPAPPSEASSANATAESKVAPAPDSPDHSDTREPLDQSNPADLSDPPQHHGPSHQSDGAQPAEPADPAPAPTQAVTAAPKPPPPPEPCPRPSLGPPNLEGLPDEVLRVLPKRRSETRAPPPYQSFRTRNYTE